MAELKVELSASIKRLERELKKAKGLLDDFGEEAESEGKKGEKALNRTGKGAANAVPTLQEFSRVIQDAPFGIQGVANNLTQLTDNFGTLSRNAGGAGNAFKLLLGSLTGPAGILFAVSAVTSLLVTYGDKLKFATSQTKRLAEATKEFQATAQSEISNLQTLVSIASDVGQSYNVRRRAINDINEQYSDYLGNLNLESIATDDVRKKIDRLNISLLKNAKLKGVQKLIEEEYADSAEKSAELLLEQDKQLRVLNSTLSEIRDIDVFRNISGSQTDQIRQIAQIVKRNNGLGKSYLESARFAAQGYLDATRAVKEFNNEVNEGIAPLLRIQKDITADALGSELDKLTEFDVPEVVVKPQKVTVDTSGASRPQLQLTQSIDTSGLAAVGTSIQDQILPNIQKVEKEYGNSVAGIVDLTGALQQGMVQGFAAIGNALATGGNVFGAVGAAILGTMGQVATQLGQTAIGIGLAMKSIKLSFTNPFAAIAAGGALVALGSSLGAMANRAIGNTTGGVGGSTGGFQGSNTTFTNQSQEEFFAGVEFTIQGQKLVGVLNSQNGFQNRRS